MSDSSVEGFQQYGGSTTAGAIAVGNNATASGTLNIHQAPETSGVDPLTEARARLDALEKAFQAYCGQIAPDQSDNAQQAKTRVQEELAKEKPDRFSLTGALQLLESSVKSVTGIAGAVQGLKAAVELLLR